MKNLPDHLNSSLNINFFIENRIIPLLNDLNALEFHSDTSISDEVISELKFITQEPFTTVTSRNEFINNEILKLKQIHNESNRANSGSKFEVYEDEFLTLMLSEAHSLNASDIHIEAYKSTARIRYRIDGHLVEKTKIDKKHYPSLINKIKIKSHLDISEKRLPQDGRISINSNGQAIDVRVSTLPTLFGEKITLRVLNKDPRLFDLNNIGFTGLQNKQYTNVINQPLGLILICGPTGSGKTTTLYATLKYLNTGNNNILSIENPIEYTIDGINQVQLKEDIGLTFAVGLRTFLRQDPDIIMLGEIRDSETANLAVRAALTGHLVFSTIHTNSALGAIDRLTDLGVPNYIIESTLVHSLSQRLIRTLCPHCKKVTEMDTRILDIISDIHPNPGIYYSPQGCNHCYHTGYIGRKPIYEMFTPDASIKSSIRSGIKITDEQLSGINFQPLNQQAKLLFTSGLTSFSEIQSLLIPIE